MGEKAPFIVKLFLLPLAFVYRLIVGFRNMLFDFRILKSKEYHVPVISVGNIMVGGTGKTPHVEYLIELLSNEYRVAVLSRGYKRKSRGFVLANENTPVSLIGDEPWQIKEKYPDIIVAVDKKRRRGIERIISEIPDIDVILLDDAFQHRYVKPGVSILLIDFNRPLREDHILPYGLLRESPNERYRADLIIFSKSPQNIVPIDRRLIVSKLEMHANQHAFFTSIVYGQLKAVFPEQDDQEITYQDLLDNKYSILLVTGIANPAPLKKELEKYSDSIRLISYPDHHFYKQNDLKHIQEEFAGLPNEKKIILTTEKDVARLKEFASVMLGPTLWYYIPIRIEFHPGEAESFNKYIFHYVRNNNRNSILYKK